MIASLPMYLADPSAVVDLWHGLARHLRDAGLPDVPAELCWPDALPAHWLAPDLLLSQTCGLPLMTTLAGRVTLVGAYAYRAPGCEGVWCRSQIVVRAADAAQQLEDLRGRRVACNSLDSQSGYNSLRAAVAPLCRDGRFFGERQLTGGHRASVLAVRDGLADVAAIDAVTLAGLRRHQPETTQGLRVLAQTARYPALPLICASPCDAGRLARLRTALAATVTDDALADARDRLFIAGFQVLSLDDYDLCLTMAQQARDQGCDAL